MARTSPFETIALKHKLLVQAWSTDPRWQDYITRAPAFYIEADLMQFHFGQAPPTLPTIEEFSSRKSFAQFYPHSNNNEKTICLWKETYPVIFVCEKSSLFNELNQQLNQQLNGFNDSKPKEIRWPKSDSLDQAFYDCPLNCW